MSFRELELKSSYDSDEDDVLNSFYIPVLTHSRVYRRLSGFFSSTALALSARGMSQFIKNDGQMELVVGARLRKKDAEAIRRGLDEPESVIDRITLDDVESLENAFVRDHVMALAWMVANERLKIKIAIVTDDLGNPLSERQVEREGIFHIKIGILEDSDGNEISFSGSNNESGSGWLWNIEKFKVFASWQKGEADFLADDKRTFDKFWNGTRHRVRIMDIGPALQEKLISIAPDSSAELKLERHYSTPPGVAPRPITLRWYQKEACESWFDRGRKGIFQMATGTGKTFTALGCLQTVLLEETPLLVVIACPTNDLIRQWLRDIEEFGLRVRTVVVDSTNRRWRRELTDAVVLLKYGLLDSLIVLTTHATFPSSDFLRHVREFPGRHLLIADEVHGLGTVKRRKGFIDEYEMRLGLSATPTRWFDVEGTESIDRYFGEFEFEQRTYNFPLGRAIREGFLVPYEYKPYFTDLTSEELERYEEETAKIGRFFHAVADPERRDEIWKRLLIRRHNIIKNAENKLKVFEKILDDIGNVKNCLVYCSQSSPQQMAAVQRSLNRREILQTQFTMEEGTVPEDRYGGLSERQFILEAFAQGTYDALVAKRCLDEGIDIKPAHAAIILTSSQNPIQYIQRRGRVLRPFKGKNKATIYDILVVPSLTGDLDSETFDFERKILIKELRRYHDFAEKSDNYLECLNKLQPIAERYRTYIKSEKGEGL